MWKVYHREIRKTSISTSTVVKLTNTENRILPFDLDGIKIILIDDSTFYTVGFSITPINTRLELVVKKPTAFAFGKVYKMKTECVYQVNPMYMHLCVFFLNSMNEKLTIKNFKRNFQNPCNITWLEGGGCQTVYILWKDFIASKQDYLEVSIECWTSRTNKMILAISIENKNVCSIDFWLEAQYHDV